MNADMKELPEHVRYTLLQIAKVASLNFNAAVNTLDDPLDRMRLALAFAASMLSSSIDYVIEGTETLEGEEPLTKEELASAIMECALISYEMGPLMPDEGERMQ